MSRQVKSVSFNLNDRHEQEMYEYAKQFSSFSGFVKRLIQNAMGGFDSPQKSNNKNITTDTSIVQSDINKEYMRQLI